MTYHMLYVNKKQYHICCGVFLSGFNLLIFLELLKFVPIFSQSKVLILIQNIEYLLKALNYEYR